jgi:hypothetical protein
VALCNALLGRMRALGGADALNGDDMLAIDRDERGEASVHAGMVDALCGGVVL